MMMIANCMTMNIKCNWNRVQINDDNNNSRFHFFPFFLCNRLRPKTDHNSNNSNSSSDGTIADDWSCVRRQVVTMASVGHSQTFGLENQKIVDNYDNYLAVTGLHYTTPTMEIGIPFHFIPSYTLPSAVACIIRPNCRMQSEQSET